MPDTIAKIFLVTALALTTVGCATSKKSYNYYDYTAYKQARPKSILVLPPLNNSPDVKASYTFMSVATFPLAEAGYYVFPVALVDQTFKENGLTEPALMHNAPLDKLYNIFAADAVLYITVDKFGTSYTLVMSEARVTAHAKLVNAQTGKVLWSGSATASDEEDKNSSGSGIVWLLISAIVKQVASNIGTDPSLKVSSITSARLLSTREGGILYGPRSPNYGKD